ncbi:MAG: hypothetical protein IJP27_00120 [Clostridia bacterium]|nr:hypothetical protein [Clostridia bacterium]
MEKSFFYSKRFSGSVDQGKWDRLPFERAVNVQYYIDSAIAFAERWCVDIVIKEEEECWELHYSFDKKRISGLMHLELLDLAKLSDAVEFIPRNNGTELLLIWKKG